MSNTVALTCGTCAKIRPLKVVRAHVHNAHWEQREEMLERQQRPHMLCIQMQCKYVSTARYLSAT